MNSQDNQPSIGGRSAKFALVLLVIVYIFNFIDRQILSILAEEIQNDLEEATEEDNWEGIGDVIHKIREALDNPFVN